MTGLADVDGFPTPEYQKHFNKYILGFTNNEIPGFTFVLSRQVTFLR